MIFKELHTTGIQGTEGTKQTRHFPIVHNGSCLSLTDATVCRCRNNKDLSYLPYKTQLVKTVVCSFQSSSKQRWQKHGKSSEWKQRKTYEGCQIHRGTGCKQIMSCYCQVFRWRTFNNGTFQLTMHRLADSLSILRLKNGSE